MVDEKEFTCKECGEVFESLAELGRHAKEEGHTKKKSVRRENGQGSPAQSLLTPEDIEELREKEKRVRELEYELKEAKLTAQINSLKGSGSGSSNDHKDKERIWILPDGSSFKGTKSEFEIVSENFQVAIAAQAKHNGNGNSEESFALKLLDLYNKNVDQKISGLNYSPFDMLDSTLDQLKQTNTKLGFDRVSGSAQDRMLSAKLSAMEQTYGEGIKLIGKELQERNRLANTMIHEFIKNPSFRNFVIGKPKGLPEARAQVTDQEADEILRSLGKGEQQWVSSNE